MDDLVVESSAQLAAAVAAAAQPTFELAKASPFRITWGTTVYTFKQGVHEARARSIVRNIKRVMRRAHGKL